MFSKQLLLPNPEDAGMNNIFYGVTQKTITFQLL